MRILCVLCVRGALGQSVGARLEFTTFGENCVNGDKNGGKPNSTNDNNQ